MRLWKREANGSVVVELESTDMAALYSRMREMREAGEAVMLRPTTEDVEVVSALFADQERHRRMAEERAGNGGERVELYGMHHVAADEVPEGVANTLGWYGPNEFGDEEVEAFWAAAERRECPPDLPLFTGQAYVSPTALAQLAAAGSEEADPAYVVHADGRDWLIDGHHRVARSRRDGLATTVAWLDYDAAAADGWFDVLLSPDD